MKYNLNNKLVDVEVIGKFSIEKNEYVVCSYMDSYNNAKIILAQIENKYNTTKLINIKENDKSRVFNCFNKIKEQLLGENYG